MLSGVDVSKLNSGMFSDSLDKLGFVNQVITGLACNVSRPKFFGTVRTVELEEMDTDDERIGMGLGFLEALEKGEILFVKGSMRFAYFGELMTRLSVRQGLEGVFIDGLTRDSDYTLTEKNLPIFCRGYSPVDIKGRGRVAQIDSVFEIDGVSVAPGQYSFADNDAIVIVPQGIEIELEALIRATVDAEEDIVDRISSGESVCSILKHHDEF